MSKTWIKHLEKLTPKEYFNLFESYPYDYLWYNVTITEKVDGSAISIGVDDKGFYMESANVGPIYESGGFSDYCLSSHGVVYTHAVGFDRLFNEFKDHPITKNVLEPNKAKITGEIMYWPFALDQAGFNQKENKVKFSKLWYDADKFRGTQITLVIFDIENASYKVLKENWEIRTVETQIYFPELKYNAIELHKRLSSLKDICHMIADNHNYTSFLKFLRTRKEEFRADRELIKRVIQIDQEKLAKDILESLHDTLFGKHYEGVVVDINNFKFKITTPEFKEIMEE